MTDRHATAGRDLVEVVRAALDGGLPAVQLREKDLPGRPVLALAEALRAATVRTGALLFVNDRVDVALAVGADGVHLGGGSMPVEVARRLLPDGALVGVSTHAPEEVAAAARAGADFAFFGPVWATPSKAAFGAPQGADRLRDAVHAAAMPVLAIGGVTAERIGDVRDAGAWGVAIVRAVLGASDPREATRRLITMIGQT